MESGMSIKMEEKLRSRGSSNLTKKVLIFTLKHIQGNFIRTFI